MLSSNCLGGKVSVSLHQMSGSLAATSFCVYFYVFFRMDFQFNVWNYQF